MSKTCYLAAPLFTLAEKQFNSELCAQLQAYAKVYLPQRDGFLLHDMLQEGCDEHAALGAIFRTDIEAIDASDVIVAILDGPGVDDGVSFELGYAFARGIPCVGLMTDSRRAPGYFKNPMWASSLSTAFASVADLVRWFAADNVKIRNTRSVMSEVTVKGR